MYRLFAIAIDKNELPCGHELNLSGSLSETKIYDSKAVN